MGNGLARRAGLGRGRQDPEEAGKRKSPARQRVFQELAATVILLPALGAAADYYPPPDSAGGWRVQTAGAERRKLDQAFELARAHTKHGGLLVAHQGWLVYERYFGRGHRDAAPNLASCGKSYTSIAVGILLSERPDLFPEGLDTKVFTPKHFPAEEFPLSDPARAGIKLGQLLAMTAGIRGNNPGYVDGREVRLDPGGPDGWLACVDRMALGKQDGPLNTVTLWTRPGGGYSYATASPHLASIVLRHATGMELQDYIERRLARPLGWGRWGWGYRRPEIAHTPGGGDIAVRATDMLRFGYLLLKEGRWRGRQIVPRAYVRHCGRRSPYNPHYPYSLQFNVNADGHLKGVPRDAFWKTGSGGHCLAMIPSLGLVIWKLGGRDEQYSEKNTGLPETGAPYDGSREGFKPAVDDQAAIPGTLRLVVEAVR